jgi:hypothetical protein
MSKDYLLASAVSICAVSGYADHTSVVVAANALALSVTIFGTVFAFRCALFLIFSCSEPRTLCTSVQIPCAAGYWRGAFVQSQSIGNPTWFPKAV